MSSKAVRERVLTILQENGMQADSYHEGQADALLREFDLVEKVQDQGPAAGCAYCVGAGGYEDHDGSWVECSCQIRTAQGEPTPFNGKWVCGKCAREVAIGHDDGQIPEHHRTCPKREQGEPTDAMVLAALNAYYADYMIGPSKSLDEVRPPRTVCDMRAALRAALAVSVQGEPTDAQVHAAAVAIDPAAWEPGIFYQQASGARDNSLELARAALRAALATPEQEES